MVYPRKKSKLPLKEETLQNERLLETKNVVEKKHFTHGLEIKSNFPGSRTRSPREENRGESIRKSENQSNTF